MEQTSVGFTSSPSQTDPPSIDLSQTTPFNSSPTLPPLPEKLEFTFAELRAAGDAMNERHDCSIIATSVVTGYAYPRIHELYRLMGRRHRCYTPRAYMIGVFAQLGLRLVDQTKFFDPSSMRTIVPQLPNKGNFLIYASKHVAGVRDGVIHDWSEQHKLYVQQVVQVVLKEEDPSLTNPFTTLAPPPKPPRTVVINYSKPTQAVHTIADILFSSTSSPSISNSRRWWSTFRAKVIAECVANGINKTTAAVQTTKWMTAHNINFKYLT